MVATERKILLKKPSTNGASEPQQVLLSALRRDDLLPGTTLAGIGTRIDVDRTIRTIAATVAGRPEIAEDGNGEANGLVYVHADSDGQERSRIDGQRSVGDQMLFGVRKRGKGSREHPRNFIGDVKAFTVEVTPSESTRYKGHEIKPGEVVSLRVTGEIHSTGKPKIGEAHRAVAVFKSGSSVVVRTKEERGATTQEALTRFLSLSTKMATRGASLGYPPNDYWRE